MARAMRVTDAEYRRRYEREVQRYVAGHEANSAMGPGETYLHFGRWAWIEDGADAASRWRRYASAYSGLKAMRPDGSWRDWDPGAAG